MPKSEQLFSEVRKYIAIWITEISLSNSASFFDINKISEGTSKVLLNMIYDYNLSDLNEKKLNFPGIDLGDEKNGISFQVTSENSSQKIISTLKTFRKNNYELDFPKGVKFLVLNKKKNYRYNKVFEEHQDIFDAKNDIVFPDDLVKEIQGIYYNKKALFEQIFDFLKDEFAFDNNKKTSELLKLNSPSERFDFYKKVLDENFKPKIKNFVHFGCSYHDSIISTVDLINLINESNGLIITGPSGCGKSLLSQKLAVDFLKSGMSIILQCKYYTSNLTELIDKAAIELGFKSASHFFETAEDLNLHKLFIVDGFNECDYEKQSKLLAEIGLLNESYDIKIILSNQKYQDNFGTFKCEHITVAYPTIEVKAEITASYGGENRASDVLPLLNVVQSSMEAKMIGEIAAFEETSISRFTLFESFLKQKLGEEKSNSFLLMAKFAGILSEKVTFSNPERTIEKILKENSISEKSYHECLKKNILNLNLGQVSFGHEMFFNFFVAESVVRFNANILEISQHLNAPKNHDKRLLILGSIDDSKVLNDILTEISDIDLLNSILSGGAGEYCQRWSLRRMNKIIKKIDSETESIEFEVGDQEFKIEFNPSKLANWSITERAYIGVIPYRLVKGDLLKDVFDLIGRMDERIAQQNNKLSSELKKSGLHSGVLFWAVYIGVTKYRSAITDVISRVNSGFMFFNEKIDITEQTVKQLINDGLSAGQFYFLLLLFRFNPMLKLLSPYLFTILQENWRETPVHLRFEIITQIRFFCSDDKENELLINILRDIHTNTEDPWMSSSIFDALNDLGALDEDAEDYFPYAVEELNKILSSKISKKKCTDANGFYNCQYDHPYSTAYIRAIDGLDDQQAEKFYIMAVKGMDNAFFGSYLLFKAEKKIGSKICPLIIKWTRNAAKSNIMPSDSVRLFLLSHIILGKYNYPITRVTKIQNKEDRSLFAAAELYYWINRTDIGDDEKRTASKASAKALFDHTNNYVIDTIFGCSENLIQAHIHIYNAEFSIKFIENIFQEETVIVCRRALKDLNQQKVLRKVNFDSDVNLRAIFMLEKIGSNIDIDVLQDLTEDYKYGKYAVDAIKKLFLKK